MFDHGQYDKPILLIKQVLTGSPSLSHTRTDIIRTRCLYSAIYPQFHVLNC